MSAKVRMFVVDGVVKPLMELKCGNKFTVIPIDDEDREIGKLDGVWVATSDAFRSENGVATIHAEPYTSGSIIKESL